MGNEVKNNENSIKRVGVNVANNIEKIDRNSFNILSLIGTGGFSKV